MENRLILGGVYKRKGTKKELYLFVIGSPGQQMLALDCMYTQVRSLDKWIEDLVEGKIVYKGQLNDMDCVRLLNKDIQK